MCDSSSSIVFFFDISKKNRKYLFSHGAESVSVCACVCVSLRIYTDFHVPTQTLVYLHELTHTLAQICLDFFSLFRSSLKKKLDHWMDFFPRLFFLSIQVSLLLSLLFHLPSILNSDTHYAIWFTAKIPQRNRTSLALTYLLHSS